MNLFLGTVAFTVLVVVGSLLLVLRGLLVVLFLVFFPVAIVVDDQSLFRAFASSAGVVRENILGAVAIVLAGIIVGIVISIVSTVVERVLPAVPGTLVGELFAAVTVALTLGRERGRCTAARSLYGSAVVVRP